MYCTGHTETTVVCEPGADPPSMTSSSSLSQVQCQGKHAIHFSLDLKLNCKVKASNIHGVRLATDNTILVRHRLYTPDSQIGNISAFYRQRFGKS